MKEDQQVYLNLGKVCDLATVRVNGIDCGTIWTAPYRADITVALKKGVNELEIEVTNTWANALKGADEGKLLSMEYGRMPNTEEQKTPCFLQDCSDL